MTNMDFVWLVFAHLVGDFVLQDEFQLLARRHLRQVPHLLPPDAPPEHASTGRRTRVTARDMLRAIAYSRDDG